VRGLTVVDFGVGESTYRLIDLGADVIVVDIEIRLPSPSSPDATWKWIPNAY